MRYLIIGLSLAQIALLIIMIINQFAMPKGYEIPAPSWIYGGGEDGRGGKH
jgi:hypothetical protein